jgi:GntR family transcriptional regulator
MQLLNRSSAVPLHRQLRNILEHMILEGSYVPGQPFLTEKEVEETFRVSRTTVREAINELTRLGYVTRRQGQGTFVMRTQELLDAAQLSSFSEDMTRRGLQPGGKVLSLSKEYSQGEAFKHFGGSLKHVWRLHRLRLANNKPISLQTSYLPIDESNIQLSAEQLTNRSLYELLERDYGLIMTSADEVFSATNASSEQAKLLEVKRGAALFCVDRYAFTQTGKPLEYVHIAYRADKCKFFAHQRRGG